MDYKNWDSIRLKLQTLLPSPLYTAYLEQAKFEPTLDDQLCLNFQDNFTKDNFEEKCLPYVKEALKKHESGQGRVRIGLCKPAPVRPNQQEWVFGLDPNPFDAKYTFETFVIGSSNQFAHAACVAVSKQPGNCYNPLFIFGGAGLGKTHLLKAIGYEIHCHSPRLKIVFLTSEAFTNELIQAIRVDRMREFREKYRTSCDVLLLDDVHFLAGKERTQEEFFYTFNSLHESRKQIVITSDRYPKDIQGLENRLQTRFEWGLVADVQPPEVETRIAILKNKADEDRIDLPNDVALYIATHITTNIRELEGSLHRLQAYASLTQKPISVDLAHEILKEIAPKIKHSLSPEAILKLVALQFNVRTADLRADKRSRRLSLPRQICFYLMRKHLVRSFPEIGKIMGGKDHTTVLHGCQKITDLLRHDPEVIKHVTTIESLFR